MSDATSITILKRNGTKEPLDISKIHKMVSFACDGLSNVYVSQVEMNSGIQFYDGISSKEIQDILIRSAQNLITLKQPNYQYVAARLLLSSLVKELYGDFAYPSLKDHIEDCIEEDVYDDEILEFYTDDELAKLDKYIKHERDMDYAYASIRQMIDKYLVQDRSTGKIYETPQFMYMMIAMTLFRSYPEEVRMKYVKGYYDAISNHIISLPTPILAGVRTPTRQFSSCVLVDVGDSLASIFSSTHAVGLYTAARAGIGLNFGRMRAAGSKIRGGEVEHTGLLPFMKVFAATTKSCTQNGVRGGGATCNLPWWHYEIEDYIVLKNNKGTDDSRIRTMDYAVHFNKLFYQRMIANEDVCLFSPQDVPELYDSFYGLNEKDFQEIYERAERAYSIRKKKVNARELAVDFLKESLETGRIYLMNVDHVNTYGAFFDPVVMSNLCMEITLPTSPITDITTNDGEIALCTLSAINVGNIVHLEDMEPYCDLAVRALEELLDYQGYPVASAGYHAVRRRSLGIGVIGLAHYMAKNKCKYSDPRAPEMVHGIAESLQYYLLKSSNQLAKERGACEYYGKTKYSQNILPVDNYCKEVDSIAPPVYQHDWEALRKDIAAYGLRHSTLTAQMPAESSAVACNATNGIEPPRAHITSKGSKKGLVVQIVPGYPNLKNHYDLMFDEGTRDGYIKIVAVLQKFYDQAISANLSYNPEHYGDNEIPLSVLLHDMLNTYKYGWKTRYYVNTNDMSEDKNLEEPECEACVI